MCDFITALSIKVILFTTKGTRPAHWHTILDDEFEIRWPNGDPIINVTLYAVQGDSPYCDVPGCISGYCP